MNQILIGKNPEFKAVFNCYKQDYTVYKNKVLITIKYKYSDIACYLN